MSDERPWEDYANPIAEPAAPAGASADGGLDYADIGKGAVGGLGRGVAGLLGTFGTAGDLTRAGLTKLGVPESTIDTGADLVRKAGYVAPGLSLFSGPNAADVQKAIESHTGEFYQPHTVPGQYASTLAEFAPAAAIPGGGSLAARAVNTVLPALASETAGQFTKGTAAEPWARGIAGLAGGVGGAKLITPAAPASAARQAAVDVLDNANIPLTASQRTGSKALQWLESNAADMPFSASKAAELQGNQANAFDRAVTDRVFDRSQLSRRGVPQDVNLPDPRVVREGKQSLSDEYTRLSQNDMVSDPRLQRDLMAAQTRYETNVLPSQRAGGARDIEQIRNDIVDKLIAGQGAMPGAEYQALRSQLGTNARGLEANQPYLAGALKDMRSALDAAMQRGLLPAEAAAWARNNARWGNMKQIEGAVARAGDNLSPQAVAQTVRAGRSGQYAAQSGDLDQLTKAATTVMKQPPNSGTAARLGWQTLFNLPSAVSSGTGGLAGMVLGGPVGGLVGAMAPHVLSRMAISRPAQAYLGNQALPQNARDVIAQALTQQATTQPSVIAQNQADRAAYERQREAERIAAGLQGPRIYVSPNRQ